MNYTIANVFYRIGKVKLRKQIFRYPIGIKREEYSVFDEVAKKWVTSND